MDGGRDNHSWCMVVVCHKPVGWVGEAIEVVAGRHAGQCQDKRWSTSRVRDETLTTPDHIAIKVSSSG